jgi:transcriptional regulator with XRE-family HTH domain
MQTEYYKRINALRKKAGLTWTQVARGAGIKISSWMTGVFYCNPTDEELEKLAVFFGVSYEYLKYGTETESQ